MSRPIQSNSPLNALLSTTVGELYPLVLAQMREYAIVLIDPKGVVLWLNVSAEELFGHKLEGIVGRKGDLIFTPEDVSRGVFDHEMATAAAQGSMENDRWMKRADGSRFWANGAMYPLRNADGELVGFCKMLRDRTDLRQQLSALRNEIHALIERGQEKDKILAVAAHELRNPLFATSVAVDALRRVAQNAPEQPFQVIERQLQTMRRLLEDITDAAQASTGKLKLKRVRLDVRDVILRALETMRPAVQARRHIVNEVLLPVPIPVTGDPDRLQQVLRNLIDNAVKYTPPGGIIGIEATIEGTDAVIKIEDNGVGVAAEMQTEIFNLFTQAADPDNLDEKGLGIGLSLVRNLVMQHGGTVQVRSNGLGKGSEFTVRLPLAS
jgi:two-component system CheB/CheR fusion protein